MTIGRKETLCSRKEAERYQEIRNWNNSLRRTHFKSQSNSCKSSPSVNFGQSHRIVDFYLDVGQHLLNPEKRTCCVSLFWLRQSKPFHQGL